MMRSICIFLAMACIGMGLAMAVDHMPLSEAEVEQTALRYAGGGTVARSKVRHHDGMEVHDFIIVNDNNQRVKIRLDARDGSVLKYEREPVNRSEHRRSDSPDSSDILTHEQAQKIALERSGGGVVVESERDYKRGGRVLYEMEIHDGDMEYEIVVDGRTGRIVKYEEDRR